MTEVASRAAQGQSIIDTISSRSPAQTYRGSRPSTKSQDTDVSSDRVRDRPAGQANVREQRTNPKSVDKTTKVDEKSQRESRSDDDALTSFEATVDTLGGQEAQPAPASINPPLAWTAPPATGPAPETASNDDSAATNVTNAAIPGHILKQASVVALLETRQRLMAAQDTTPAPHWSSAESDVEETVTMHVSIQSREAHWVFDNRNAGSDSRMFDTLTNKTNEENALSSLSAAAGSKSDAGASKLSTDMIGAARSAEPQPTTGTAPQQNFGDTQGGGSGSRKESATPDAGARRILDASASTPVENITQDVPETPPPLSAATQQVRSGVLTALAGDHTSAEPFTPRQPADQPPAAGYVLRSIDLTLSPPDLGTVRLKLSLKASALDIDAEASKAATAKLLDDDRKGLEQSLRDAGYDVKNLKISDISSSSNSNLNSSLNNGSSTFQDGSQARANLGGRQDEGMPRREGEMPDQSQQRRRNDSQQPSSADIASGRQANAIYI